MWQFKPSPSSTDALPMYKAQIVLLVDLRSGDKQNSENELFFNIPRTNSKTSKVNQQSVLNL